jgi:hypothetical protein
MSFTRVYVRLQLEVTDYSVASQYLFIHLSTFISRIIERIFIKFDNFY